VAALGVLVATFALALLQLGIVGNNRFDSLDDLLPVLIASALLCVIALARRRSQTVTWLATIAAAAVVARDVAGYAADVRGPPGEATVDPDVWLWLSIAISLCALLAVGAAASYAASRSWPLRRWAVALGIVAVAATVAAAIWALASPGDLETSNVGSVSRVTITFLIAVTGLTLLGLAGDAWPAAERARRRARMSADGGSTTVWLRAFADELAPGRARARRATLDERSRIARDLHADVVPGLRRALADAERDAPPDELAATLREVLADVESLGAARHAVQLDIGGLVPALEWLAERVEERSEVRVTLEVAETTGGGNGEAPREAAAAAFRVAGLALENVVRHAAGANATVAVASAADAIDLAITDDGPGFRQDALAAASRDGRRGLADMAAEAAACDATVDIETVTAGHGTVVTFRWRAPGTVRQ